MGKRLTTEEFIQKARNVHGNRYDYSNVEYINNKTPVCIICPEHGKFWQIPNSHLRGIGCDKCGGTYKCTTEDFIAKAREVHGDKYDYSKVKYINAKTPVCLICPEHGKFWQKPANHINNKAGCPECSHPHKKYTTEDFIAKAREVHGDKYDYSKVEYVNGKTRVCIICPEHGEFWQLPSYHLQGHGCDKCGGTYKHTTEEFISKAREVHGDKYDYSKVEYVDSKTPVRIICPEHGDFLQTPNIHLKGCGCHNCWCATKSYKFNLLEEFKDEYSFRAFLETNDVALSMIILRNIEPKYEPIKEDLIKIISGGSDIDPIHSLEEKYKSDDDTDEDALIEATTTIAEHIDRISTDTVDRPAQQNHPSEEQHEPSIEDVVKNRELELKVINRIEHMLTPEDRKYIMRKFFNDQIKNWDFSVIPQKPNITSEKMTFEDELNLIVYEAKAAIFEIRNNGPKLFNNIDSLNVQQALTIHMFKDRDFFLNHSDPGSGKTKAAISVSYYFQLKHVLVFCPNSVKTTWRNQILESNFVSPDNVEIDGLCDGYSEDDFTYEIFNYDKFNSSDRGPVRIKSLVNSKRYDFLILDEVHKLKNKDSETYKNILTLVQMLRKINPHIKIFGATATPITTSNSDLQGIYEIMSGKKADELTMGSFVNRLINANKILEISGYGESKKSNMSVRYNGIEEDTLFSPDVNGKSIFDTDLANIDGSAIEKDIVVNKGNIIKIEELHLSVKFNAYKHLVRKGTVIYTEYTYGDRILRELKDMVEGTLHLSACIYSGDCKETEDGSNSIEEFKGGSKDVLIGTKSMCEGVDGLQLVCNRVILHTIPTVWSVMWQLKGRFDRQGSKFMKEGVDIFVPMVVFRLDDGRKVSIDMERWRYSMKRRISDRIIKGGHFKEITLDEKREMIDSIVDKLKNKHEMTEIEREEIEFDCPDIENSEWKQRESLISDFNRRGRNTNSARFHQELTEDPKGWFDYHRARRESMKDWPEIPYEHIASKIKNRNRVVADFGCGENQLRNFIPNNKVYAFDHVAADETVTACDMAHTPLDDESIDIAVFSLALWGTNYEDYIKEAYRVLNYDGLVYIAEPSKSYDAGKRTELLDILRRNGFTQVGETEDRGKFFYITVMKK